MDLWPPSAFKRSGGNVIRAELVLYSRQWFKCTCKDNFWDGRCRRNKQQEPKQLRLEPSPCVLTLRSVIKDRNQRETPEASPTPLFLLAQPPSPSSSIILLQPRRSHFLRWVRLSHLPSNTLHILFPFLLFSACHLPSHSRCTSPTPASSAKRSWHKSTSLW